MWKEKKFSLIKLSRALLSESKWWVLVDHRSCWDRKNWCFLSFLGFIRPWGGGTIGNGVEPQVSHKGKVQSLNLKRPPDEGQVNWKSVCWLHPGGDQALPFPRYISFQRVRSITYFRYFLVTALPFLVTDWFLFCQALEGTPLHPQQ